MLYIELHLFRGMMINMLTYILCLPATNRLIKFATPLHLAQRQTPAPWQNYPPRVHQHPLVSFAFVYCPRVMRSPPTSRSSRGISEGDLPSPSLNARQLKVTRPNHCANMKLGKKLRALELRNVWHQQEMQAPVQRRKNKKHHLSTLNKRNLTRFWRYVH